MALFSSSAATSAPNFLPDAATRTWLAAGLQAVIAHLGAPAARPVWLSQTAAPRDLDALFDFICAAQSVIGQQDVEFTLIDPPLPDDFSPLGNPQGHLLHTFARGHNLALVVSPQLFRVPSLLLGHVARELGRIGLWQQGPASPAVADLDSEVAAELAAIALGMGSWVANGAYLFNNACCGGGCGIDLRSIRAALSLPEACYALALDAQRKHLSRRQASKALESTQAAALKHSWTASAPDLPALPAALGKPVLQLGA